MLAHNRPRHRDTSSCSEVFELKETYPLVVLSRKSPFARVWFLPAALRDTRSIGSGCSALKLWATHASVIFASALPLRKAGPAATQGSYDLIKSMCFPAFSIEQPAFFQRITISIPSITASAGQAHRLTSPRLQTHHDETW